MKTNNDVRKTLETLQQSGKAGVHSFDLNHIVGTTRAAARIQDLKELGYTITAISEVKNGCRGVRYFLGSSPTPTKQTSQKPIRWVFDTERNVATPVYA